MKRLIFTIYLIAWSIVTYAQADSLILKNEGSSLATLVPISWKVLNHQFGDLNQDGCQDLVFVIQNTDSKYIEINEGLGSDSIDLNPRVLGIYFGNEAGDLFKELQSNQFIILRDSPTMDEPFEGMSISQKGILSINFRFWYSAGSWYMSNHSYKFRFQNEHFALIGYESTEAHRGSGETTDYSINFLTKKMEITKGNFAKDEPESVKWKTFKLNQLKTLESIGKPFEWKFEGFYL